MAASSIAELSQEIDKELRQPKLAALYKDKVSVKGAVADGLEVTFDVALKMPTRLEAIGRVITLALSPASRIAGQTRGPGRQGRQPDQDHQRKEPEDRMQRQQLEAAPADSSGGRR